MGGRHIYAIGIIPQAAFLAALPVRGLPFVLYIVTGVAASAAGVLLVSRLDNSSPGSLGLQMELQALTIILLGGVAFAGGRRRILGVLTAWLFLGVVTNGLTLLNVAHIYSWWRPDCLLCSRLGLTFLDRYSVRDFNSEGGLNSRLPRRRLRSNHCDRS